ncbi:Ig-like domain-containing protein [Planococcus sp. N064]|uniref:Ig-like domain-containing protein n=1 Tax=Planococcus liqunii TaxID=3058394 RepID=A0ABT8MNB5_9BACL|nr:Ig-like domain-containing protein [Planococcus sp. N064]MDN7226387.1 Ig-like domain-containing protein [Planococcus sp. N064]
MERNDLKKGFLFLVLASLLLFGNVATVFADTSGGTNTDVADKVLPSGLKLSKASLAITTNQTYKVAATIAPANVADSTIIWKSSNPKAATVDAKGTVKGIASGKAVITATAKANPAVAKTLAVTVSAKTVKLNKASVSVVAGQAITLTATVSPVDSTPKTVTWKSSNAKIATVDAKGKIIGKAKGTATITASVSGGKAATAKVTVTSPIAAQSVKLDKTSLTLAAGKTYALKASISPSTTTNKSLKWKTSNAKVATVDSKGVVKAVGAGSAKITATTANGKTVTATVTVPYVKTLSAGTWKGGTHIAAGRYKITTKSGAGNLFITPATGDLYINEILAGPNEDWGVQMVTTDIKKGDKIEILSLDSVQFTKVTNVKSNTLHAGNWTVGKDIAAGRYRVTTPSGAGNLVAWRGYSLVVNEMLSAKKEPYYVTSVTQTFSNGDRIEISGLNKVVFTKSK